MRTFQSGSASACYYARAVTRSCNNSARCIYCTCSFAEDRAFPSGCSQDETLLVLWRFVPLSFVGGCVYSLVFPGCLAIHFLRYYCPVIDRWQDLGFGCSFLSIKRRIGILWRTQDRTSPMLLCLSLILSHHKPVVLWLPHESRYMISFRIDQSSSPIIDSSWFLQSPPRWTNQTIRRVT